ncbi:MAG: PIN domain-containing protein [Gaiellaceae bacterium]
MGRRLILDTSGLIAYERETITRSQFAYDDIVVAAVSIAEFRVGAERADTPERRDRRLAILADIRASIDVLDYTEATAVEHAKLLAVVRRRGRPRGLHDLIIAAHAAETDRTVVSTDAAARFSDLPGVTAISPSR